MLSFSLFHIFPLAELLSLILSHFQLSFFDLGAGDEGTREESAQQTWLSTRRLFVQICL